MASVTRLGLLTAVALPLAFTAFPAAAQTASSTAVSEGDIIVTARRTEERLQNVPTAVTALTAAQLEAKGAENIGGLQGSVPNLNIVQGRGTNSSANIFIRGVGQPDALQTFDPGVGIYLDDVYISRIRGALFDVYDIGRIEVLRGPQGTLYGKNTIGGAVKIVSRRPTDKVEGAFSLTGGDFETLDARARLSGPLGETLKGSVALYRGVRDGYVDGANGVSYNDKDTTAGRASLFWTPSAKFDVVANVDYTKESPGLTLGKFENTLFRTNLVPTSITVLATPAPGEFNYRATPTARLPNKIELEHAGVGVTASYKINDAWSLKSITGARELTSDDYIDIDGTRFELGDVFVGVRQDQISQELQALYSGDKFRLVSGLYFLRETMDSRQFAFGDDLFSVAGTPVTFRRPILDSQATKSYAGFAQGEFDVTDTVKVAVGLRSTRETKDYWRFTTTTSLFTGALAGVPVAGLNGLTVTFRDKASWQDVSPAGTITWQPSKDATFYAKVSKGFKSGGFNGRANGAADPRIFAPETLVSTEGGAKTTWLDGKLIANLAVFHNEYENFQARVSRGDTATATFGVINAGKLEQQGAELEVSYRPVPSFGVNAQVGWLDASYNEFVDPNGAFVAASRGIAGDRTIYNDRSWQTPAFSPELTVRLGADYRIDLGGAGSITLNGDANYKSETALAVDNADPITRAKFAGMWQDEYWLYNARIAYSTPNDRYTLALIGRNLSDEAYRTDAQEFSSVAGIRTSYWGAPRTVLVQAGVKF